MLAREVVAVLEFFSPEAMEPDGSLLEVMSQIGTQLGRVVERRRAEEAVRDNEERFRAVAEPALDAIITADALGSITYFNHGAERVFGYGADEVIGKPLTILMPERFRDAHSQGLRRFVETGESHVIGSTAGWETEGRNGVPPGARSCHVDVGQGSFFHRHPARHHGAQGCTGDAAHGAGAGAGSHGASESP